MNIKVGILFFSWVLLLPFTSAQADNPWEIKLPFEQATINYSLSGMETGSEILYIKDFGRQTARYRTTKASVFGMTMHNKSVEIISPDWIYKYNLEEGTGTKSINPQKLMIEAYNDLDSADQEAVLANAEDLGATFQVTMHGEVEKNVKKILGYSCDRVSALGSTTYTIHATPVVLHSESNIMGISVKSVATKIDYGEIDKRYFEPPEGIVAEPDPESDEMAKLMADQTISMLKDPQAYRENAQNNMLKLVPERSDEISPEEQQQVEDALKTLKGLFGN